MLSFVFPLLADSNANIKVQVFVLRKDTADTIGVKSKELIRNNQSVKKLQMMCIIFDGCIHPHQHPGQRRRLGHLGFPALTRLRLKSSVVTTHTRSSSRRRSVFWLPWQLGRILASYICKILIFLLKDLPSAHQHQVCRYGMRHP